MTVAALQHAAEEIARLRAALVPFANCCDQIADAEDDEEWAKFRLLVKDYRRARAAMDIHAGEKSMIEPIAELVAVLREFSTGRRTLFIPAMHLSPEALALYTKWDR